MVRPDTKRLKKVFRKRRRKVGALTDEANRQLDKHVFKPINNFQTAWRFIISWLLLLAVLVGGVAIQARALGRYYTGPQPVAGGVYIEGIEGSFGNVNPIYATSAVDTSVSRLLFSGLLKYDNSGKLVSDLADSWSVDDTGKVYTFNLRPNVKWHDGIAFTSDDVVFTIQAIQNPDTKSPYNLSWQGVAIKAVDDKTVQITLPNPLSSFPYSMTQGIIPHHRFISTPYGQLRSNEFSNKSPVGTGPFSWNSLRTIKGEGTTVRQRITLRAYDDYHFGKPHLDGYTIETFENQQDIIDALKNSRINAATVASLSNVDASTTSKLNQFSVPLLSGVYLFFNTSKAPLDDKTVRQGLERAVDVNSMRDQLGYPTIGVTEPFLRSHSTYDATRTQLPMNKTESGTLLDKAGWTKTTSNFVRQKDQKALEFTLLSEDKEEYARLADLLQRQLADVGVKLTVELKTGREFQQRLLNHDYDALLYGISLGADPDVFAYWHSSQAVIERFNFSVYKSTVADSSLEAGRTRSDPQLRAVKYRPFLDAWREDVPAVGIYQPRLLFVTNGQLYGFNVKALASTGDRYATVHEWMFNTEQAPLVQH